MAKVRNKSVKTTATQHKSGRGTEAMLPTFSENLMLLRKSGNPVPEKLLPRESVGQLLNVMAASLAHPGISREVIFHSRSGRRVDAYSVSPDDPTKIVRERADGSRAVGRLVGGRFRALPAK